MAARAQFKWLGLLKAGERRTQHPFGSTEGEGGGVDVGGLCSDHKCNKHAGTNDREDKSKK